MLARPQDMPGKKPAEPSVDGVEAEATSEADFESLLEEEFGGAAAPEREPEIIAPESGVSPLAKQPREGTSFEKDPNLNPFGLTQQELRFCWGYATGLNGKQAAEYAGYAGGSSTATKLLQRQDMASEIRRIGNVQLAAKKVEAPGDKGKILDRLWEIGTLNIADAYITDERTGKLRPKALHAMPQATQRAIKRIRIVKGEVADIEFHDSMAALAKLLPYYHTRPNGSGGATIPIPGETEEPTERLETGDQPDNPTVSRRSLTVEERLLADGSKLRTRITRETGPG